MADLETRLRDLMAASAPADPATEGLAQGARAYAARARRARIAGAAVLAVLVVLAASLTSTLVGGRQASPPVSPTRHLVELTRATCASHADLAAPPRTLASAYGMVAARLCAVPGDGGDGWVIPDTPVANEEEVARLRQALIDAAQDTCGKGPTGPPFVLALEKLDGTITGYRSADLPCGGRAAVGAYLESIALQRARLDALSADLSGPNCHPPAGHFGRETLPVFSDPAGALGPVAGGGGAMVVCLYPQYSSSSTTPFVARDYRVAYRSPNYGARSHWLSGGISAPAASLSTTPHGSCRPTPWWMVIRIWGAEGGADVEVRSGCVGVYELSVQAEPERYWTPSPDMAAHLAACLEPEPRCD